MCIVYRLYVVFVGNEGREDVWVRLGGVVVFTLLFVI